MTQAKEKKSQSNNRGQKRATANILRRCEDLQANTARIDRPYCTQACLLGLIRGHVLDEKCPNVQAHRKRAQDHSQNTRFKSRRWRNDRHVLDQPTLARLLDEQLQRPERYNNGDIKSLKRCGWAGALFRIELLSHGYTFVGKGTVQRLIPYLKIEANMYKQMDTIQGKAIPVYIGNVDLKSPLHLSTRLAIVHFMLLSWAGEETKQCEIESKSLRLETARTIDDILALGVQLGARSCQNILWNFELDRAILTDFGFAPLERAHFERAPIVIDAQKKPEVLG